MNSKESYWRPRRRAKENQRRRSLNEYYQSEEAKAAIAGGARDGKAESFGNEPFHARLGASSTQLAYQSDQRIYLAACQRAGEDPLDPPWQFWESFFGELAEREIAPGRRRRHATLWRYAYGISNYFVQHGRLGPTSDHRFRRLMRNLAVWDDRDVKKARALFGGDAIALLEAYDLRNLRGYRDKAIAALGTLRGFRSATIVGIQRQLVAFDPRGVKIGLKNEKTRTSPDTWWTATRHTAGHRLCLPCILGDYMVELGKVGIVDGPLFRKIDRWGNISSEPLVPKSVTNLLRHGLKRAGIKNERSYSSHSYRHGVVTTCILGRWTFQDIMQVTLHRSVRGLMAYVDGIDPFLRTPPALSLSIPNVTSSSDRGWTHGVLP
jgi:hypothetical protein